MAKRSSWIDQADNCDATDVRESQREGRRLAPTRTASRRESRRLWRQRRRGDDDHGGQFGGGDRATRREHRVGRCRYEPRRRRQRSVGLEARESIGDVLAGDGPSTKCYIAGRQESRSCREVGRRGRCPIARRRRRNGCCANWIALGRHAEVVVLDVGSGLNHVVQRFWQAADSSAVDYDAREHRDHGRLRGDQGVCTSPTASRSARFVNRADPTPRATVHLRDWPVRANAFWASRSNSRVKSPRDRIVAESASARRAVCD